MERIQREKERERGERVKSAKEDAIKHALKMKKRVLQVDAAVSMSLDHATAEARKIAAAKHEMESQSEIYCRAISFFFFATESATMSSSHERNDRQSFLQFMMRLRSVGAR